MGSHVHARRDLWEFLEKAQQLSTPDEIVGALGEALQLRGIENYLFSFLGTPTQTFADITVASRIPAELAKVYGERGYIKDDPGFRHLQTAVRPFRWFAEAPYDPEREPRAVELVQLNRDFGLIDGIVIPVLAPGRRLGQVWFGGSTIDLPECQLPGLHLMAVYAFDRIVAMNDAAEESVLTPREREVLTLSASGLHSWQIAERLHIAERTVIAHIKHCCTKLGAVTRTQAVAIAMRRRIIFPQ